MPRSLLGRRLFTPVFLLRQWQIEKGKGEHAGEFEEPLVTDERLIELRSMVAACFPKGRVTWSLSRGAILSPGDHWSVIRRRLTEFREQYGDAIVPNPVAGYTVLHRSCAEVEEELFELLDSLANWLGESPRAVHAWILLARTIERTLERFDLDAVSGQCWSQYGVDHMSMEGSVPYPYYPSRRHFLVPGRNKDDQLDVPLLDVISLDPVTARFTRKQHKRFCRMGLQLLETVNWKRVGPEHGLQAMQSVARTYLTDNRECLPFSWITTTQELVEMFRHPYSFSSYRSFWESLAAEYSDLEVITTADFGRDFKVTYRENDWHYRFRARGSGVGPSDPETEIAWEFTRDMRRATLTRRRWGRRREQLIDYVDYTQDVREHDGPSSDYSLKASPWQKRSG